MYLASALLILGIQGLNTLYGQPHHGLVADLPSERLVIHACDMQISIAAIDSCVAWWSAVAKGFCEAADFCPPLQRRSRVGGWQHRDSAFDDRFHIAKYKTIERDLHGLGEGRQDFFLVRFQRGLFLAAHQIHVELRNSNAREFA